jgi:16S rRNA C1402 N4-methylase RsmH
MPSMPEELRPKLKAVGKVVVANDEEVQLNRRARSARLRIAERT